MIVGVKEVDSKSKGRRTLILLGASATILPSKWGKPVLDAVILPAHAQTSCSGFTTTAVSESLSLTVTATQVSGPIEVSRSGLSFIGTDTSTVGGCSENRTLTVRVDFAGTIDPSNNEISGDITILQTCGGQFVCEQISQFSVQQQPAATVDEGDYQGMLQGALRCCNDFAQA